MLRKEVYKVLDGERDYQEKVWGEGGERRTNKNKGDSEHTVGDWITFMEHYIGLAKTAYSTKEGCEEALNNLRKTTALAIACFEQHGVPERKT